MAEKETSRKRASSKASNTGFTAEERAAMKERAREAKRKGGREADERALMGKIAELPQPDRSMAERIHAVVTEAGPELAPRTWYGMPAWAKDGKVLCFFTPASKFKERYASFGFNANANLDEGNMWPTSWALTELTEAEEAKIRRLVRKALR